MLIRKATSQDIDAISALFFDTVTAINKKDYTPEQITVWSASSQKIDMWAERIATQHFFVAILNQQIVGFSSLSYEGYLDFMYIHKDFQGQGMASALLFTLKNLAKQLNIRHIWADVSITAQPFFLKKDFVIRKITNKEVKGIIFENAIMDFFEKL
jgi:putative acetyltransferase